MVCQLKIVRAFEALLTVRVIDIMVRSKRR